MRRLKKKRRRRRLNKAAQDDKAPARSCVATGAGLTPETGLRFVLSPEGDLAPDFSGKLPGRGAWLALSREALAAAVKKGAFARALKASVKAPDDLAARIEAGLAKAALSALGLARRAGDVATGFEKTRAALKEKKAAALINAADAGEDGRRKLAGLAGGAAVVELFAEAELAAALGREERTAHAALIAGPHAVRFLAAARRLESFGRAAQ